MRNPSVENFVLYGLSVLRDRIPALSQHLEGLRRGDDIEHVHRMRVAARRARNALALFSGCLPEKQATAWRREIRRVGRALGAARDLDVQAAWVEQYLEQAQDPVRRAGISRLLLRLRQERARQQRTVVRVVERLEKRRVLEGIAAELHEMIVSARLQSVAPPAPDLLDRVHAAVRLRLEDMLAFEPFVRRPERVTELHDMRIAAKHLRYTLEVFAPVLGPDAQPAVRAAKGLQELLGRIHDADVRVQLLGRFLEDERARTIEYFGDDRGMTAIERGVDALCADVARQRDDAYEAFVGFWRLSQRYATWETLRGLVRPRFVPPPEPVHAPGAGAAEPTIPEVSA
jgi:CHAD domain-containing protein